MGMQHKTVEASDLVGGLVRVDVVADEIEVSTAISMQLFELFYPDEQSAIGSLSW